MADDPIQVDDGGSTRVKLFLRNDDPGEMDGLFSVKTLTTVSKPYTGKEGSQTKVNHNGAAYGNLRVTYVDSLGLPFSFTSPFVEFHIISGKQAIHGEVLTGLNAGDLMLTVFADLTEPIVDSRQTRKRRRYVVTNAPPIHQVLVKTVAGGAFNLVYQASVVNKAPIPNVPLISPLGGATDPVFYSTVVVT
jgi:hypothetical protein